MVETVVGQHQLWLVGATTPVARQPQPVHQLEGRVSARERVGGGAAPKRGRKPKKISIKKTLILPEFATTEKPAKSRPKKVSEEVEPEPAAKSARSTRSTEGRSTRSKDWSWEKVLLINPDKISKKKI